MIKKLFLLSTIVLTLNSCTQAEAEKIEIKESLTLKQESYQEEFLLSGTLVAAKETKVAAKASGRIASLNFDIGDFVFENTLLGALAGDESLASAETARINEQNVWQVYNSQKNYLDKQVESAEKAVELAKTALNAAKTAKSDTSQTTAQQSLLAEKTLEQAKTNLENVKTINKQRVNTLYNNAKTTIRNALSSITNASTFADSILAVSNEKETTNDSFENLLGNLNKDYFEKAKTSLRLNLDLKNKLTETYNLYIENKNPSHVEYDQFLEQSLTALESSQTMLKDLYNTLENTSSGNNLSSSTLEGWKDRTISLSQSIEAAILSTSGSVKLGVKGIILSLEEQKTAEMAELKSANAAYLQAEQALNQTEASSVQSVSGQASNIEISAKQLTQAESALSAAIAARESSLKELKSQIDLIKGNKKLSQIAVKNTHIGAPFTGVITEKYAEVGQVITAGQPVFEVADNSAYKIVTDISDKYANKLKIGLEAEVTIDGVSGTQSAELTKIYPKVDPKTRKITLELSLKNKPTGARIGLFTNIKLKSSPDSAYFIPKNYLIFDFNKSYVLLPENQKQEVSLGAEKDQLVKIWFPGEMEGIEIIKPSY